MSRSEKFSDEAPTETTGASERFRKWSEGYKFVRTLYNLVVKVVCLKL